MVPAPVAVPIGGVFRKVKRGVATLHATAKILVIPALAQMVNATREIRTPTSHLAVRICDTYPQPHHL
jgi:hypothetical protein